MIWTGPLTDVGVSGMGLGGGVAVQETPVEVVEDGGEVLVVVAVNEGVASFKSLPGSLP